MVSKLYFREHLILKLTLTMAVVLNGFLWLSVRHVQPQWNNVPPVPSQTGAVLATLGDKQFAYRTIGLSVQNFGDTGGRIINLADYDYETLGQWMRLAHKLDPLSNFMPALAAYLYGGSKDHDALSPIIDYLEMAGSVDAPHKWRWLGHAVFLARHKMKDMERALELAYKLAAIDQPDMPAWPKQMPAFVMNSRGEKEDALALMIELLKTEGDTLHPNEVNAIKGYVCEQILEPQVAKAHALCEGI